MELHHVIVPLTLSILSFLNPIEEQESVNMGNDATLGNVTYKYT